MDFYETSEKNALLSHHKKKNIYTLNPPTYNYS